MDSKPMDMHNFGREYILIWPAIEEGKVVNDHKDKHWTGNGQGFQ